MGGPDGKPYAMTESQIFAFWPDRPRSVNKHFFLLIISYTYNIYDNTYSKPICTITQNLSEQSYTSITTVLNLKNRGWGSFYKY